MVEPARSRVIILPTNDPPAHTNAPAQHDDPDAVPLFNEADESTTVYVNPDDPTEAHLDAPGNWEDSHRGGRTIGGFLLLVIGTALLAYAYLSGPF